MAYTIRQKIEGNGKIIGVIALETDSCKTLNIRKCDLRNYEFINARITSDLRVLSDEFIPTIDADILSGSKKILTLYHGSHVTKKEENVNDLEVSITLEADTETKQQYLSVNTGNKTVSVKLVDLDGSPYTKTANNGDFDKRFTVTKSNKKLIIDDNEVGQRYTIDDGVKVEKIEE